MDRKPTGNFYFPVKLDLSVIHLHNYVWPPATNSNCVLSGITLKLQNCLLLHFTHDADRVFN